MNPSTWLWCSSAASQLFVFNLGQPRSTWLSRHWGGKHRRKLTQVQSSPLSPGQQGKPSRVPFPAFASQANHSLRQAPRYAAPKHGRVPRCVHLGRALNPSCIGQTPGEGEIRETPAGHRSTLVFPEQALPQENSGKNPGFQHLPSGL